MILSNFAYTNVLPFTLVGFVFIYFDAFWPKRSIIPSKDLNLVQFPLVQVLVLFLTSIFITRS